MFHFSVCLICGLGGNFLKVLIKKMKLKILFFPSNLNYDLNLNIGYYAFLKGGNSWLVYYVYGFSSIYMIPICLCLSNCLQLRHQKVIQNKNKKVKKKNNNKEKENNCILNWFCISLFNVQKYKFDALNYQNQ